MTSQGSPYARFRRALATGDLNLIRAEAAELPSVDLKDALAVCVAVARSEPQTFERAALRWLARFCVARPDATVRDARQAADAFEGLRVQDPASLTTLEALAR